jgi:NADH-quinone oxidoreductase subunit E
VLEVATFYTQFQLQPVGTRAHVQVCGTTPCMLRGAGELIEVCKSRIHHDPHHLNEDGTLSWEEVECAGACVNAPMVTIYHDTYEDLTAGRLEEIIDAFQAGKGDTIKPGTQIERLNAAADGKARKVRSAPARGRRNSGRCSTCRSRADYGRQAQGRFGRIRSGSQGDAQGCQGFRSQG